MNFEAYKIGAAFLTAGIAAVLSGMAGNLVVLQPVEPATPSYEVVVAPSRQAAATSAPAAVPAPAPSPAEAPVAPVGKPAGPEPIEPLLAKADVKAGVEVAKKCTACHTLTKGGPVRVGPNLYGIVGAGIAQGRSYAFSEALKTRKGKWTPAALNEWLWQPQEFAKGTKMGFPGLAKAKDRADIIAYLATLK
jgi:cytochrome c